MWLDDEVFRRLCRARAELSGEAPLATIARQAGMSPFHFVRRFNALFGTTPHQRRIAERIDRARMLLAGGSSVTEACFAVGFSSLGSFSALFRRRVGEAPSVYRRRTLVQVPGAIAPHSCFGLMALAFRNFGEAGATPAAADCAP